MMKPRGVTGTVQDRLSPDAWDLAVVDDLTEKMSGLLDSAVKKAAGEVLALELQEAVFRFDGIWGEESPQSASVVYFNLGEDPVHHYFNWVDALRDDIKVAAGDGKYEGLLRIRGEMQQLIDEIDAATGGVA